MESKRHRIDSVYNFGLTNHTPIQTQIHEASNVRDFGLSLYARPRTRKHLVEGLWCSFDDVDLSPLHNGRLKHLSIYSIIGTIDLTPLVRLSSVKVTYYKEPHDRDGYEPYVIFPESDSLEEVTIQGSVRHDYKTLANLTNLRKLTFHNLRDTDLSWLNASKSLKHIHAYFRFPKSVILPAIATLDSLRLVSWKIRDPYSMKMINLDPLRGCKNLKEIRISKQRISEIDFSPLSHCDQLEEIYVVGCNLQTADLSQLKSLKKIVLQYNKLHRVTVPDSFEPEYVDLRSNAFQRIDLNDFSSSNLKHLDLSKNPIIDLDLVPLSACVSLEKLEMEHNQLKTVDLTPLAGLEHFRSFKIKSKFLPEIDITPLLSCPALEEVKVGKSKLIADKRFKNDSWRNVEWY